MLWYAWRSLGQEVRRHSLQEAESDVFDANARCFGELAMARDWAGWFFGCGGGIAEKEDGERCDVVGG